MSGPRVGNRETPRGVLQVWQAKELQGRVFGSVANKGVAGEIVEVWQRKDLREVERKVEGAQPQMRGTARWASMAVWGRESCPKQLNYYS